MRSYDPTPAANLLEGIVESGREAYFGAEKRSAEERGVIHSRCYEAGQQIGVGLCIFGAMATPLAGIHSVGLGIMAMGASMPIFYHGYKKLLGGSED